MSRLSQLFDEALEAPALSPTSVAGLRARISARHRRRRRYLAGSLVVAGVIASIGFVVPSNSNSDFGLEVSGASSLSSLPGSLSRAMTVTPLESVSLGLLPSGFVLTSSEIDNSSKHIPFFEQRDTLTETYTRTTSTGIESLVVTVVESSSLFQPDAPLPFQVPISTTRRRTKVTLTDVGGARAVLASTPFVGATKESCMSQASAGYATAAAPTITLAWLAQPGVMVQVTSEGLAASQLREIAANLKFNAATYSCLSGEGVVSTSGDCAPGSQSSPEISALPISGSAPAYALGTVGTKGWLLQVESSGSGVSWRMVFDNQLVSQNLSCPGDIGAAAGSPPGGANVRVSSDERGDRFAVGYVPSWVNSVSAASQGTSVSETVIRKSLAGQRFFVLYLGSRSGRCADICTGPVTLAFTGGRSGGASVTFNFPAAQTGPASEGLDFTTNQLTGTQSTG